MKRSIQICWLYPDLMSTYGDFGNIVVLARRCTWRGISVSVKKHTIGSSISDISESDLLFMGGAQDRQQDIVSRDLTGKKADILRQKIDDGIPGLFICGAYQFLGNYYLAADNTKIQGLGIFDLHTVHPGDQKKRLIGNILVEWNGTKVVGFENHGGRTFLGKNILPFARVAKGHGNNGEDDTEGVWYKNSIGSYLHGPLLPKNPEVADWLIKKTLERKYATETILKPLNDTIAIRAREEVISKMD